MIKLAVLVVLVQNRGQMGLSLGLLPFAARPTTTLVICLGVIIVTSWWALFRAKRV